MDVLSRKSATVKGQTPKPIAEPIRIAAPVRGWVLNESLASPLPGGARILDNYICDLASIRPRKGYARHATLEQGGSFTTEFDADFESAPIKPVRSMFTYRTGSLEKFFAATDNGIFDVTSPAAPDSVLDPDITGLSNGYWFTQPFGTAGGDFVVAVNGEDFPHYFDGANWNPITSVAVNNVPYDALTASFEVGETVTGGTSGASATILSVMPSSDTEGVLKVGTITSGPFQDNEALTSASGAATANGASASASSITISGVTTTTLSHVWSFASRLFFVQKNTMLAWYLPVDAIGGAANSFSLAGVFKRGGALWFGATWSTDAGDGLNDQCLFFSTEGEVAIYRGTNPGSAAEWSLVGVYDVSKPLGPRATMKAGGDLLVATEVGLVPISEALTKDVAALSLGAASRAIEPHWQRQVSSLSEIDWQIAKIPSENIMVVTQPESTVVFGTCLVANLQTGAWSRFTGMDTQSVAVFDGAPYFGTANGAVFRMQTTGADAGSPYTCSYLGQFEGLGLPGVQKTVLQARPVFISNTPIIPKLTMKADYDETLSSAPNALVYSGEAGWDVSLWDDGLWDAIGELAVQASDSQWTGIGVTGYAHAPELQLTFGSTLSPDVEYIGADVTFRTGAMVA